MPTGKRCSIFVTRSKGGFLLPTMHMTREVYEKLREKLTFLVNVRRKEIAK